MEDWKNIRFYEYFPDMRSLMITKEQLYQDFLARMLSEGYIVNPKQSLDVCASMIGLTKKPANKRFVPPTIEEIRQYCKEKGIQVDPAQFVNFYEAKGWMIGKNKMKSWKAAIQTWNRTEPEIKLAGAHKPYKPSY